MARVASVSRIMGMHWYPSATRPPHPMRDSAAQSG